MLATNEQIQDMLDECSFRPFGQARWDMSADDVDGHPDLVEVTLEHWVNDSRTFEHWDEYFQSEIKPQTFTRTMIRPEAEMLGDFLHDIVELIVHCVAHEACEWFVAGADCEIVYDPHEQGDPVVSI